MIAMTICPHRQEEIYNGQVLWHASQFPKPAGGLHTCLQSLITVIQLWCSQSQHCTELWCWVCSSHSLWYVIVRQGNFQQPLVVITKVKRCPVSLLSLLLDNISLSHWIWATAGHCKLCVGKCETAADSSGSVPKMYLEMTSEQDTGSGTRLHRPTTLIVTIGFLWDCLVETRLLQTAEGRWHWGLSIYLGNGAVFLRNGVWPHRSLT